jgi:Winged helix DNA-binding domain
MERQLLDPLASISPEGVVRRLGGVQAQVASTAELAVRVRRVASEPGDVDRALADGRLFKTWAMRGTLHLLAPGDGAAFLSLIAGTKPWARPAWDRYFDMNAERWEAFREAVVEALDGESLTREELIEAIVARPGLDHVGDGLRSSWGTMLKPLAWQGELCIGPNRGNRVTFRRPSDAVPGWAGLPPPEEASPVVVAAYFGTYGPAPLEAFHRWMGGGWLRTRELRRIVARPDGGLTEVDVEGDRAFMRIEDVDALAEARPSDAVRLLPGFDAWVLGPGTTDTHVIPPGRRSDVSRQAGWISPIVVSGGVVAGTWQLDGDRIRIAWFAERGRVPTGVLEAEVERLGSIVGRDLDAEVALT